MSSDLILGTGVGVLGPGNQPNTGLGVVLSSQRNWQARPAAACQHDLTHDERRLLGSSSRLHAHDLFIVRAPLQSTMLIDSLHGEPLLVFLDYSGNHCDVWNQQTPTKGCDTSTTKYNVILEREIAFSSRPLSMPNRAFTALSHLKTFRRVSGCHAQLHEALKVSRHMSNTCKSECVRSIHQLPKWCTIPQAHIRKFKVYPRRSLLWDFEPMSLRRRNSQSTSSILFLIHDKLCQSLVGRPVDSAPDNHGWENSFQRLHSPSRLFELFVGRVNLFA